MRIVRTKYKGKPERSLCGWLHEMVVSGANESQVALSMLDALINQWIARVVIASRSRSYKPINAQPCAPSFYKKWR